MSSNLSLRCFAPARFLSLLHHIVPAILSCLPILTSYHVHAEDWTPLWTTANLSQARNNLAAAAAGGKVFFGGGSAGSAVDVYDTTTGTWSTATLSQPRTELSAASVGNKVFFGGGGNSGFSDVVDVFDTTTGTWSTTTLPHARTRLAATSAGDRTFFGGGLPAGWYADYTASGVNIVPEPSTFALLGVGAIGVMGYGWRRRLAKRSRMTERRGFQLFCHGGDSLLVPDSRAIRRPQLERRCEMRGHIVVLMVVAWMVVVGDAWGQIQYTVTDLGTLGGSDSYAYGINASGQVVGYASTTGNAATHAFLYSNGIMKDLGTLGGSDSYSVAINDGGQVVGDAWTSGNVSERAFLYSNGVMTDLGTVGGNSSGTQFINASGQVVGQSAMPGDTCEHGFLYSNGTMTDLGTLGGSNSQALGINSSGQIVGYAYIIGNTVRHGFLYSGGTMTDLGTLDSGMSIARRINASGQIAGNNFTYHAALYSDGIVKDLGTLGGTWSESYDMNDSGQVVGDAWTTANAARHGFLYSNGTMTDLNAMIDPSSGWTLEYATAINNNGWIAGYGTNPSGQTDGFLLTPSPEPSTLALLGVGAIGLLGWTWRGHNLRGSVQWGGRS